MALLKLAANRQFQSSAAGLRLIHNHTTWHCQPRSHSSLRCFTSQPARNDFSSTPKSRGERHASTDASISSKSSHESTSVGSNQSMPPGWEDDPDLNISAFSELPHRFFGTNQHIRINEDFKEALRQILWRFRAPIRYAFAYGSGVFSQSSSPAAAGSFSPHPNPPEAVIKWQQGGGKIIDFIFGVSFTQHWHSINLQQHPDHYSALRLGGSYPISKLQDSVGAGVYFNPYITVNGTMIKYGVVNLDTIKRDLSEWDTLYLAGRLQKPVKILRDDPQIRLANQLNLISAVRTALLMLPETFTEKEFYEQIAGISYLGDPRMSSYVGGENPKKVSNIVSNQLPNFRQLYVPLVENLPNVSFNDHQLPKDAGWEKEEVIANSQRDPREVLGGADGFKMQQDMDPKKRGNMVRRLPKGFRQKLYYQYQKKFQISTVDFDKILQEAQDEDATGFHRRMGGDFDRRIGMENDLNSVVGRCISNTIGWPSTSQTIKSVFTAGVGRSWKYYMEKRGKSKEGKKQGDAQKQPEATEKKQAKTDEKA